MKTAHISELWAAVKIVFGKSLLGSQTSDTLDSGVYRDTVQLHSFRQIGEQSSFSGFLMSQICVRIAKYDEGDIRPQIDAIPDELFIRIYTWDERILAPAQEGKLTMGRYGNEIALSVELNCSYVLLEDGTVVQSYNETIEIKAGDAACMFKGALYPYLVYPTELGDEYTLIIVRLR
ncbi:hypothetical protein HD806DRAFT_529582 [Xylariaceae sp. AK1471]|nr:hypothetical protein HD806DRAFT_529582 [Xylariaceae sp. AK1471]